MGWGEMGWGGMGWRGKRWAGGRMGRAVMEWDGLGRAGMG